MARIARTIAPSLGLVAALVVHVALCLLPASAVLGAGGTVPRLASSDAFYHAHRIANLWGAFPRPVYFDRFVFFPRGAIAEWPLGFDWVCAAALRAVGAVSAAPFGQLAWYLPFVPLCFSLATVLAFCALARRTLGPILAALATLAFGASLALCAQSVVGQLDHHVAECLGVSILLFAPDLVSPRGSRAASVAAGLALAWLIWCSTLFAWIVALLGACWVLARSATRQPPELPHLRWFAAALLGLSLPLVALESHARSSWASASTLSLLQWVAIAAPLSWLVAARRTRAWVLVAAALLGSLATWLVAPRSLSWVLALVTGRDEFLANVTEAKPLFLVRDGLSPGTHALRVRLGVPGGPPVLHVTGAPARWSPLAGPGRSRCSRCPCRRSASVTCSPPRSSCSRFSAAAGVAARWRPLAAAVVVVLLLEPAATSRAALAGAVSESTRVAWMLADALEGRAHPGEAIAAPPNYGNALLWRTGLPIVTNTFFWPRRYLRRDLELRSFEGDRELGAYLRRNGVRWLVVGDDVRYRAMLLELFGHVRQAARVARLEARPCRGELLRWAYDRLACRPGPTAGFERIRSFTIRAGARAMVRRLVLYRVEDPSDRAPGT